MVDYGSQQPAGAPPSYGQQQQQPQETAPMQSVPPGSPASYQPQAPPQAFNSNGSAPYDVYSSSKQPEYGQQPVYIQQQQGYGQPVYTQQPNGQAQPQVIYVQQAPQKNNNDDFLAGCLAAMCCCCCCGCY